MEVLEREVIAAEAPLAQCEEKANASLAPQEAGIQAEVNKKTESAYRALIKDHRKEVEALGDPFLRPTRRAEGEINDLKKKLAEAAEQRKATLDAQAVAEADLASLHRQVGYVTYLVEQATDKANQARGLQGTRSQMFQDLERRARHAPGSICKESVSTTLVPADAGYLAFLTRVVDRL